MDFVNNAVIAALTFIPFASMYMLIGATVLLAFLSVLGTSMCYRDYVDYAELSRKEALKGAWADLKYSWAELFRDTKDSIVAKAYASARLVKLLGAYTAMAVVAVPVYAAMLAGLVAGPVAYFGCLLKQAFMTAFEPSMDATDVAAGALVGVLDGRGY